MAINLEKAGLVLRLVSDRDMDGYTLASKSGLQPGDLQAAVQALVSMGLLRVKGDTSLPKLMDSWFQAPAGALGSYYSQASGITSGLSP
jgi:hypothetical protein